MHLIFILGFISSFIVTYITTPFVKNYSLKKGLLDMPNDRKDHKIPIVRLGGISIFSGFIISNSAFLIISALAGDYILENKQFLILLMGVIIFFLIGLSEDLFENIDPILRLFIQFAFSSLIWSQGLRINGISLDIFGNSDNNLIFSDFISLIFTSIFIVGIVNALNWIDGLDGLAGGISLISLTTMAFIISPSYIFVSFCLIGSCFAFLRFNYHPASIIMGDGGSYFLGGLLSIVSLKGINLISQLENAQSENFILPIQFLFILFCLPLTDLILVTTSRVIEGYSPFYPDRRHLHHKMLNLGLSHRDTVILFYGFTQLFVSISLYIYGVKGKLIVLCLSLIFVALCILYCINFKNKIKKK